MKQEKTAPATKNLRVLHTQLDGWPKGAIVAPDDLPQHAPKGSIPEEHQKAREVQVKRLIDLGAVEEVTEGDTTPMPEGPHKTQQEQTEAQRWGDGNHPLSYFADRSDDDILKLSGIGPASLKEIRDAQAAQKK